MEILLDIKSEYLRLFLAFIFEKQGDIFVVSRKHDFGKFVCSRYRRSDLPVRYTKTENTVQLKLPIADCTKGADKCFIYFSKEDIAALNDALDAYSNLDFDRYYMNGRKIGFKQKDIIEAYIQERLLFCEVDKAEMLKKRKYREEEQNLNKLRQFLRNKAIYYNERIEKSMLEKINTCISEL